jgi:hypothetical protein
VFCDRFGQRRLTEIEVEVQATTLGLVVAKHLPSDFEIGVGWWGGLQRGRGGCDVMQLPRKHYLVAGVRVKRTRSFFCPPGRLLVADVESWQSIGVLLSMLEVGPSIVDNKTSNVEVGCSRDAIHCRAQTNGRVLGQTEMAQSSVGVSCPDSDE